MSQLCGGCCSAHRLNYEEVSFINQPLASRVNNINPFHLTTFYGEIQLDPKSDQWVRNIEIDGGSKTITGSVSRTYVEKIQVSSVPDTHIRSRNVTFEAIALRPVTRHFTVFDKTANLDVRPKLVELSLSRLGMRMETTVSPEVYSKQ